MCLYIYILEEYWQIFVDDGLVPRDATDLQASAQPKALFSYATTVMGKICCWDKEDKWCVSLYAACMSTTSVYCVMDRKTTQHFLKRRMLSIMESVHCVRSRLNVKLDFEQTRITKYHEVTRTRLLESIPKILDPLSKEDWDLDKEMVGWELGDSLVLLSPVLSVEEVLNNDLVEK